MNEKIFENGKIFQYQEINESQEIINHIAINLFTEKTCLSDISEIKKKFLAVRDQFLNQDLDCLADPSHLCLIVGTALLEADIGRGTGVLSQIRRSYVRPSTDEDGHPIIAVKGNVTRKTNSGKSKHYKPMDFRIRGQQEVKAVNLLLSLKSFTLTETSACGIEPDCMTDTC